MSRPTRIAIIGAGPAGATTALLLARRGLSVALLDDGRRPDLLVGESLVPQLTALFQELGIEKEVRALGVYKPGVTFAFAEEDQFALSFTALRDILPNYAYNVPREPFDRLILEKAIGAGVHYVQERAHLLVDKEEDKVRLSSETLASIPAWQGAEPDFVIDASGRRRLLAQALGIGAIVGPRRDLSHFAHYEGCRWPEPAGQVEIRRLARGWSWSIPLPGPRLSIGVVVPREVAQTLGATAEEQLEAAIERDPGLAAASAGRCRVSAVATFTNYQLISERGVGSNWAMVGDAFGFVDPMLSPGLCMAMTSAQRLATLLPASGGCDSHTTEALAGYARWMKQMLTAWQEFINYFYDGRVFAIHRSGSAFSKEHPGLLSKLLERHASKHLSGMASGALVNSHYSRGLLRFMEKHLMNGVDPQQFAIR